MSSNIGLIPNYIVSLKLDKEELTLILIECVKIRIREDNIFHLKHENNN